MMSSISKNQMGKLPKIVAIDFDGTLVEDKYPQIGLPNLSVFSLCKELKRQGVRLILWSCRDGDYLQEAVSFCSARDLYFDSINQNIKEVRDLFSGDTRKVYADLYLDDKSVHLKDMELCTEIMEGCYGSGKNYNQ